MRKILTTTLLLPLLLCGCGGVGSKSNDSLGVETETTPSEPKLLTLDLLKERPLYDNTKWVVDQDYRENTGEILQAYILSDNYYIINGENVGLQYLFQIVPEAKNVPEHLSGLFSCSLALARITNEGWRADVPLLLPKGNEEITVKWNGGGESKIKTEPNTLCILWYYPASGQFQKELNKKGGFEVSVKLSTGEELTYFFDTSKRDKLQIENLE